MSVWTQDSQTFLECNNERTFVPEAKQREGKFLLYWMTTTSVITTTSFTLTQTLASIACTPSSFVMSNCASLG